MAKKQWLSWWIVYGITLVYTFIGIILPVIPAFIAPVVFIGLIIMGNKMKILKPFSLLKDISLIITQTFMFLFISLILLGITLESVDFLTLLGIGLVSDGIAFFFSLVPFLHFIAKIGASIVTFTYTWYALGGTLGFFLAVIVGIATMIPNFPAIGRFIPKITISLLSVRFLAEVIGGIFG